LTLGNLKNKGLDENKRRGKNMFYEVAQLRIRKELSKKHLELWKEILDEQKSHSGKFYHTRSRILQSAEKEANPDEETWMVIDEYEDREAYDKMCKAMKEDPELKKLEEKWHSKWDPMSIPGSLKAQHWIERAKVELKK
jgi:hypothetical protein